MTNEQAIQAIRDAAIVQYFYSPIHFYNGKVLKCQGICTDDNRKWFLETNPGTVVVNGYLGDRIKADTHEPFTK